MHYNQRSADNTRLSAVQILFNNIIADSLDKIKEII
nr:MAG TPA: hypothetical protein [Caudoviricetes sp.]